MKRSLILSTLLFVANVAASQNIEVRVSGGKGFAKGGMLVSDYDEIYTSSYSMYGSTYSDARTNVSDHYFSVGQGTRFEGSVIVYFQEHIGFFVQSGYSSGSQNARTSYSSISSYYDGTSQTYRYLDEESVTFSYVPVVVGFHAKFSEGVIRPYCGAGAGLYLASSITDNVSSIYPNYNGTQNTPTHVEREWKLTSNKPIGYVAYLGISYAISNSFTLFAEGKATLVSFFLTQSELTMYDEDGVDKLPTLPRSSKIRTYEENHNFTISDATSQDQPSPAGAPPPISGNSIGLTIGLSIAL